MLALLGLLFLTRRFFSARPTVWAWVLEVWIAFLPIATGLLVYAMFRVTTISKPDDILPDTALTTEQKKEIIKYGVAAIGALLAAAVAGDPAKAENPFWPSSQFKRFAQAMAPPTSHGHEVFWYAAVGQCTRFNKVCGWGGKARRVRAKLLERKSKIQRMQAARRG